MIVGRMMVQSCGDASDEGGGLPLPPILESPWGRYPFIVTVFE